MHKLPPLSELRAFEAAARHLSFKKAATELGVTPTAVSHQIKLLERYCGRSLFRRRPRPMTLTAAGARLFPVVRDGLEVFATTIGAIKRERQRQALRVTTTNAFASRWLVPRLPRWRKVRPDTPLEVIGTDSVLNLGAGDAEIAIRYARTAPSEGIVSELVRDSFWPICSPELRASGLWKPTDLRKHILVHCYWSPSDFEAPTWQRWLTVAPSRWSEVPELTEMEHLSFREELHAIEAVISGQGIGLFSNVLVEPELKAGTLVKAFDLSLPGYEYFLVRQPSHPQEKIIQAFAKWLQSVL
jgi:LysR family transcriptional regulator, glycine cleavage system transcriptional activator